MQESEHSNRADPLKSALGDYLAIPGMKAAILISDQGLMISSAARDEVDTATIAALVIDTVATAQRFGLQVQAGFLDTMSIEFEKLAVVLVPFTTDVMLALVATPGSLGGLSGKSTQDRHTEGSAGQAVSGSCEGGESDSTPRAPSGSPVM
jgi:predicted regulator of Ras-like GTPase activity (Roadblock/LC7/MglB family)